LLKRLLGRLDAFFGRRSRNTILAISLFAAVALGVFDHFNPGDFLILYLLPLFLASWYGGWRVGLVVSIYAAASEFVIDSVLDGHVGTEPGSVLTFLVRLGAYLLISKVMAQLRETIRQREELTEFIVHDLRSPLASSITGLHTLSDTAEHLTPSEQELIDLTLVSNKRALNLVNSILDVAKLESGAMVVAKEETRLEALVSSCFEQVELWARGHDVELASEVAAETAFLDPELTSRVLVNLLSNALKFSPEEGVVLVKVTHSGHATRFAVVDQGPGIPPEYVDTIFEPFGQVKGTRGGTGLGLTFCRLAVQAQGGKIWVESQVGKGTTMLFTVPDRS
jgi:signal transduction histidine kinase